ncbi:unnamed protein product [Lymnaea stagnalis]|uniref:THD domain-containing protein n=1 Tax=Lymnaea stagnalis TaxID=6523 RepID=A0AAV2HIH6_LYMST
MDWKVVSNHLIMDDKYCSHEDELRLNQHVDYQNVEATTSNFSVTLKDKVREEYEEGLTDVYTSLIKDTFEENLKLICALNIEVSTESNEDIEEEFIKVLDGLTVTVSFIISKMLKFDEKRVIGRVCNVYKYTISDNKGTCLCQKCQHSEKPKIEWGKVMILTKAHHVVSDDLEEIETTRIVLSDARDGRPVTLDAVSIKRSNLNDDWLEVECVSCDIGLLDSLRTMQNRCSMLWKIINTKYKNIKDGDSKYFATLPYNMDNRFYNKNVTNKHGPTVQSKRSFRQCFTFEGFSFIVSFASLIIAVISIATVCVKIRNAEFRSDDFISASAKNKICLSCTHSSLFGKLEEINKMLEEVTRATHDTLENSVQPQNTKSHTPSSAHIHLQSPPKMPGTEGDNEPNFSNKDHIEAKLQVPSDDSGASQHARGIHVGDNGIHILYSGLYYIYSKVDFKTNTTKPSSEFAYQTWFHYVHRISPNSPMNSGVLLRTVFTACPFCNRIDESGFTGGIFHLQAGDKIQVCFSGQGFIDYEPNTSFLGLFMLVSPQDHHLDVGV